MNAQPPLRPMRKSWGAFRCVCGPIARELHRGNLLCIRPHGYARKPWTSILMTALFETARDRKRCLFAHGM